MVALAAIVESSAVPIEPPTCWLVLTVAEATPASWESTPRVPLLKVVGKIRPSPTPRASREGRMSAA